MDGQFFSTSDPRLGEKPPILKVHFAQSDGKNDATMQEFEYGSGGSRQPLAKSTASVAAGRLAAAVRSQPDGGDPQRLALVLLS